VPYQFERNRFAAKEGVYPMTESLWIILALIIGGVWLFWPRSKTSTSEPIVETTEPAPTRKEIDAANAEIEKARKTHEQMVRDDRDALKRHHESLESDRQKLARAQEYLEETGLDRSIPDVWETVQYWPSWVNMPDRWTPPEGITDIKGSSQSKEASVEWQWKGHHYDIHFIERYNYAPEDDDRLGEIAVSVDGETVCGINCAIGTESYDSWRCSGVEALKVGPWMSEFVALAGYLHAASEASSRKTFGDFERERAKRIDLGD
jgi:hypothetical protein